jgi:hypothetical protein
LASVTVRHKPTSQTPHADVVDAFPIAESLFYGPVASRLVMIMFYIAGKLKAERRGSRLTEVVSDHPFALTLSFENTSETECMDDPPRESVDEQCN